MRPIDFVIIGAQKCGTTSLAEWLAAHPQVTFCRHKEPHFFSKETSWERRLNEYHSLFPEKGQNQLWGEASTSYTFRDEYPGTAHRLQAYNSSLKLIYIVRDPLERITSHYAHRKSRKRVRGDIDSEVLMDPIYINRSKYWFQLEPYLQKFSRQQIQILTLRSFWEEKERVLDAIANLLDIDSQLFPPEIPKSNPSVGQQVVTDDWMKGKKQWFVDYLPDSIQGAIKNNFFRAILSQKDQLGSRTREKIRSILKEDIARFEAETGVEVWNS